MEIEDQRLQSSKYYSFSRNSDSHTNNESYLNNSTLRAKKEQETEDIMISQRLKTQSLQLKNHFIIQIVMNILIAIAYIVAISTYRWYELKQVVPPDGEQGIVKRAAWLNFIYISWQGEVQFLAKWTNYDNNEYCRSLTPDPEVENKKFTDYTVPIPDYIQECLDSFKTLRILGLFCFVFILVGFIANIIHCYLLMRLYRGISTKKTKFYRTASVISSSMFFLPVGLYLLVILIQPSLKFKLQNFGFCYYMCFGCIIAQCICLIYFSITRSRLQQREDMKELLDGAHNINKSYSNPSSAKSEQTSSSSFK